MSPAPKFKARAVRAFTLMTPAQKIYAFIRDPEELARAIRPKVVVAAKGSRTFLFRGDDDDTPVTWEAVIVAERRSREIEWECRQDGKLVAAGVVTLEPGPGDEGTELKALLEYNPKGGRMGAWLSRHHPAGLPHGLNECLRRIKALLETGEIPTTEGQPTGAREKKVRP